MNPTISPPSDNLYKFLAVAGIMILAGSFVYPAWQRKEFDQLSARYDGDNSRLQTEREIADEAENDAVKRAHVHGKELAQLLEEAKKSGKKTVALPKHLQEELDRLEQVLQQRRKTKAALILRQKELETRRIELILTRRFLNDLDYWSAFFASLGFLVSLLGFSKWFGSQRIQDQVLRKELTEGDEENMTPRPALIISSSDQTIMGGRSNARLRTAGFVALGLGACVLCTVYIVSVKVQCDTEKAILDRDAVRQQGSDLMHRLFSKTMDSSSADDVKLRRKKGTTDRLTNQELLDTAEKWGEEDPDAKPLKGLLIKLFAAQDREEQLANRLQFVRYYTVYGYSTGAVLLMVGVGCLLLRSHLVNRDPTR